MAFKFRVSSADLTELLGEEYRRFLPQLLTVHYDVQSPGSSRIGLLSKVSLRDAFMDPFTKPNVIPTTEAPIRGVLPPLEPPHSRSSFLLSDIITGP